MNTPCIHMYLELEAGSAVENAVVVEGDQLSRLELENHVIFRAIAQIIKRLQRCKQNNANSRTYF